jgi:hypothetical protein
MLTEETESCEPGSDPLSGAKSSSVISPGDAKAEPLLPTGTKFHPARLRSQQAGIWSVQVDGKVDPETNVGVILSNGT